MTHWPMCFTHPRSGERRMADSKTDGILESVGQELKTNPPRVLANTKRKLGVAKAGKQRVAILLSKARKLGANIPKGPRAHK